MHRLLGAAAMTKYPHTLEYMGVTCRQLAKLQQDIFKYLQSNLKLELTLLPTVAHLSVNVAYAQEVLKTAPQVVKLLPPLATSLQQLKLATAQFSQASSSKPKQPSQHGGTYNCLGSSKS